MKHLIVAFTASVLLAGTAMAQTPAASPATTPAATGSTTNAAKAPVVRTAKSLDCSKQADTKGLHGKPRKTFMSTCKKA
ncbi:PsiF family protein [Lichenifustis flavocetrariae]|uniref:PsiF family protein n=1 Tax=Lichenifustis flavocetrariae TaxID=2949735 RepID=A0AA42CGG9_9HYPH|nr:PsiF family protein [Lichenifustis flavocetrariae]MCW6506573.1 PsiF family protein [Lichenifustis flavocetrariae]